MHKFCGSVAAIALLSSSLAWAGPLPAGKPAGVHQAQLSTGSMITLAGLGALSLTIIAVAASGDDTPGQSQGGTTTTSSTSTTS
jgi:hypothetical protein